MTANARAWELRHKLFALLGEFQDFRLQCINAHAADAGFDAETQAAAVADELGRLCARLETSELTLFFDAACDTKDQQFGFPLRSGVG